MPSPTRMLPTSPVRTYLLHSMHSSRLMVNVQLVPVTCSSFPPQNIFLPWILIAFCSYISSLDFSRDVPGAWVPFPHETVNSKKAEHKPAHLCLPSTSQHAQGKGFHITELIGTFCLAKTNAPIIHFEIRSPTRARTRIASYTRLWSSSRPIPQPWPWVAGKCRHFNSVLGSGTHSYWELGKGLSRSEAGKAGSLT